VDPGEELLEELRATDDDRVEVDLPGPGRILAAADLDEWRDRPRLVRQQQELVRGPQPENGDRRDEQDDAGAEQPAGGEPADQSRLRVRPPSTGITAPVT
jgi:antitoxin component of MazEF toxin-antitoxin module